MTNSIILLANLLPEYCPKIKTGELILYSYSNASGNIKIEGSGYAIVENNNFIRIVDAQAESGNIQEIDK
jgi:hypothetical protein